MSLNKIAIGAIFKNEFDYIIEWFAWHRLSGFKFFYVADNDSTDGTRELLEAISAVDDSINILYQPTVAKNAQIRAYNTILNICQPDIETILFIDADEFLVHDSYQNGEEYRYLESLLLGSNVGAIGINWRVYGSSGLLNYDSKPVTERFTLHSADYQKSNNCHIKAASKVRLVEGVTAHFAFQNSKYKMYGVDGQELSNFINDTGDQIIRTDKVTGITENILASPLRINHYVIKSKEEFIKKKSMRGCALNGPESSKNISYFDGHDFSDEETILPTKKIEDLNDEINKFLLLLKKGYFYKKLRGCVDISNQDEIRGWMTDEEGLADGYKLAIFINGVFTSYTTCKYYRQDVLTAGSSTDGYCGFRYQHPKPLIKGDTVKIFIFGNSSKLNGRSNIVIE